MSFKILDTLLGYLSFSSTGFDKGNDIMLKNIKVSVGRRDKELGIRIGNSPIYPHTSMNTEGGRIEYNFVDGISLLFQNENENTVEYTLIAPAHEIKIHDTIATKHIPAHVLVGCLCPVSRRPVGN